MLMSSTVSSLLSPTPTSLHSNPTRLYLASTHQNPTGTRRWNSIWNKPESVIKVLASSSENPTVTITSSRTYEDAVDEMKSAADIVRSFYGGINGQDLESVEGLIAENCVYEDLIFPRPFVGRKAILEFFKKFMESISKDLQFVIDDISAEDSLAVGVTWHLEWRGKPFPFSKGCSFYRLEVINGNKQIIYGRDSVEPAIKPGEATLVAIRGVTWLFRQFPQLIDWL